MPLPLALGCRRLLLRRPAALPLQHSNLLSTGTGIPHRCYHATSMAAGEPAPAAASPEAQPQASCSGATLEHAERAWQHFRKLGSPKYHVAPMVDQSELPFRMLCRQHGATAAYTPMISSRLFVEDRTYREDNFHTCEGDRPLFVQFCANDPQHLLAAAKLVGPKCDYIDINLGCPQRIAKRGYYGAFLMDDLALVESLVTTLVQGQSVPVSCKIRIYDDTSATVAYAQMLERAGCSLLAVHGRTREMKNAALYRANWDAIKAVREAVSIPVLANGNVRTIQDAHALMEYTGAVGVLSADPLLVDPALFAPRRLTPEGKLTDLDAYHVCRDYLSWVIRVPAPMRMVKGHMHKMLANWMAEFTDMRERLSKDWSMQAPELMLMMDELGERIAATGRDTAVPQPMERKRLAAERAAAKAEAKQAAIEAQEQEEAAIAALDAAQAAAQVAAHVAAPAAVGMCAGNADQVMCSS